MPDFDKVVEQLQETLTQYKNGTVSQMDLVTAVFDKANDLAEITDYFIFVEEESE